VHSPKCGNGNRPIDKAAALRALSLLLGHETLPEIARSAPAAESPARPAPVLATSARPPRVLFFDLETQRSAEQVGGWHNAALMRVALAVSFDDAAGRFETWRERDVHALLERLAAADLVVGFNVERFDYRVLRGYTDRELGALPTFDLLEAIHARIGFRLPLGHLAEENLGAAKSGDGLQALAWWRQGRLDLIEATCSSALATASACGSRRPGRSPSSSSAPARGARKRSLERGAAAPEPPLQHLEVEQHEDVLQLARQLRDEPPRLVGVGDAEDRLERRLHFETPRSDQRAHRRRVLLEGGPDRRAVEQQMDPVLAGQEDPFGIHAGVPPRRPRSVHLPFIGQRSGRVDPGC